MSIVNKPPSYGILFWQPEQSKIRETRSTHCGNLSFFLIKYFKNLEWANHLDKMIIK